MKYKNILFDLDGTITDSSPGIINSYKYSLHKFGLTENDENIIRTYIGSPLRAYYSERQMLSHTDSEIAVKFFREHYNETGIYENNVYPGLYELISELYDSGCRLYIATSKPEKFALTVLDHFKLDKFFSYIKGSDMSPDNKPKSEIIRHVIETNRLTKPECIMVGDRYHDIRGAKENGIRSAAVTYGYGSASELKNEFPDHIVSDAAGLREVLLK